MRPHDRQLPPMRRFAPGAALCALVALMPGIPTARAATDRPMCAGITTEAGPATIRPPEKLAPWGTPIVVHELPVIFRTSTDTEQRRYVVELLEDALPAMHDVLGPPLGLDSLRVSINPELTTGARYTAFSHNIEIYPIPRRAGYDEDGDGRIDEDPFDGRDNDGDGLYDEDLANAPLWDSIFIHELAHAFQTAFFFPRRPFPSWFEEGMADATAHFVDERIRAGTSGRGTHGKRFDLRILGFDQLDFESAQLFGGGRPLAFREYPEMCYQLAAGTLILPALAELSVSGAEKHPLHRLNEELRFVLDLSDDRDLYSAIDEAWSSPVDGVLPPSRWVRARSVTIHRLGEGVYAGIHPDFLQSLVNPKSLVVRIVDRGFFPSGRPVPTMPLVYTNAAGESTRVSGTSRVREVPDLAPGAYAVHAKVAVDDGLAVTARNWILVTAAGTRPRAQDEGIALIFVGTHGLPIDPPELEVDGRVLERVKGGALVAPHSALKPGSSMEIRSQGRAIASISLPGDMTRNCVIHLGGSGGQPPIRWEPYLPAPGEEMTVTLRRQLIGIDPLITNVDVFLYGYELGVLAQGHLLPTADPDVLQGRITLPKEEDDLVLWIGFPGQQPFFDVALQTRERIRPIHARVEGGLLLVEFDAPVRPTDFVMERADHPRGPWISLGNAVTAEEEATQELVWAAPAPPRAQAQYYRVVDAEGKIVLSTASGAGRSTVALAARPAFPNPSPDGFRWGLELETSLDGDFEVFDARGRRVHGPEPVRMRPGYRELRWNGMSAARSLASGVYYLRLRAPGVDARQRVVLLRDRTR